MMRSPSLNIETLLEVLSKHTGTCIVTTESKNYTYEDLMQTVEGNISHLEKLSIPAGNAQVVLLLDVGLGWRCIPIILAAMYAKLTIVPFDPFHGANQARLIRNTFPEAVIIDDTNTDPTGRWTIDKAALLSTTNSFASKEIAFIFHTSGTTGYPKKVMLSYSNFWSNLQGIMGYFHLLQSDRVYIIRPLTNASAITGEIFPSLLAGASICVKDSQVPLSMAPAQISKFKATILGTTPTVASMLIPFKKRFDFLSLRILVLSGEFLHPTVYRKVSEAFSEVAVWNAYGLTEGSPRISCATVITIWRNCVTAGVPLCNVKLRITGFNKETLQDGDVGELAVSGPNVMAGYYQDQDATDEKIQGGWLYTGDLGFIKNNHLYIIGRKDHMLIRAGVNIYPEEIEALLCSCPGIYEAIAEESVIGNQKTKIQARIVTDAEVKPKDVYQYLKQIGSDPLLWPDEITLTSHLPKTASGKLIRTKGMNKTI